VGIFSFGRCTATPRSLLVAPLSLGRTWLSSGRCSAATDGVLVELLSLRGEGDEVLLSKITGKLCSVLPVASVFDSGCGFDLGCSECVGWSVLRRKCVFIKIFISPTVSAILH